MKLNKPVVLCLLASVFFLHVSQSQTVKLLGKVMTLAVKGEGGKNGASVAFNPVTKKYYAVQAGNESFPICVYNDKGVLQSGGSVNSLIDTRGLWYNPKTGKLQGNGYDDKGWFEYQLDAKGIPVGVKILHEGTNQPDAQSLGAFDAKNNLVYFFDGLDLYSYNAATAELKDSKSFDDMLADNDSDDDADSYNSNAIVFTGIKDKEIGFLNVVLHQVELFNLQGKQTTILTIPEDQPIEDMFNFSYCNGIYWFFNTETRVWTGYKEGAVATKNKPAGGPEVVVGTAVVGTKAGAKGKVTKVNDPGELYSTPNLGENSTELVSRWKSKYGNAVTDEMLKRSQESGWPDCINDLTKRNDRREKFKEMVAYYVDDIGTDRVLLFVPAAENKHLAPAFDFPFDFYMVYGRTAVTLGDKVSPVK